MAESLISIKRRIASTKSTGKITQAMQMVSGAKLNQVEQRSINYQIYANKIREIVTHLAVAQLLQLADNKNNDTPNESDVITINDLLQQRPVKKQAI